MTQAEIERTERMIAAMNRLSAALEIHGGIDSPMSRLAERLDRAQPTFDAVAAQLKTPSPGWWRMLDDFKGAVSRMSARARSL